MRTLAAVLMVLAWPFVARAELPPGVVEGVIVSDCGSDFCVVPRRQFEAFVAGSVKMLRALKEAPPKCATLQVEPKKDAPPPSRGYA